MILRRPHIGPHSGIRTPNKAFTGGAAPGITRYRDAVLADSPVAYWRLAEPSGTIAADSAGTFTGTYVNVPTLGAVSAVSDTGDAAVTFAAVSSQVVTAALASSAVNNFALECWMKLPSLTNQLGVAAFNGDDAAGGGGFGIGIGNGSGAVGLGLDAFLGNIAEISSGYTFSDTNYHHAVLTREAGTLKWYVDKVQTPNTSATAPIAGAGAVRIACQRRSVGGDYRFFNGTVDEVAIYNTALTAVRVAAHFDAR